MSDGGTSKDRRRSIQVVLLFLCDEDGITSVAKWIHIDGAGIPRPVLINEKMRRTHKGNAHDHGPDYSGLSDYSSRLNGIRRLDCHAAHMTYYDNGSRQSLGDVDAEWCPPRSSSY